MPREGSRSIAVHLAQGAMAGLIATVPMTVVMLAWHRHLPATQRYHLPPRIITDRATARSSFLHGRASRPGSLGALAAHFGFGAATGALYAAGRTELHRQYPASTGIGYGLIVWAASYLGWVPAMGLMPPATRQPAARNAMMIAAHIVWGSALGFALNGLSSPSRPATRR
jgi:uncharacterized membrane protein YagU involved in acid resistance